MVNLHSLARGESFWASWNLVKSRFLPIFVDITQRGYLSAITSSIHFTWSLCSDYFKYPHVAVECWKCFASGGCVSSRKYNYETLYLSLKLFFFFFWGVEVFAASKQHPQRRRIRAHLIDFSDCLEVKTLGNASCVHEFFLFLVCDIPLLFLILKRYISERLVRSVYFFERNLTCRVFFNYV